MDLVLSTCVGGTTWFPSLATAHPGNLEYYCSDGYSVITSWVIDEMDDLRRRQERRFPLPLT